MGESGSEFVVPLIELKPEARLNRLLFLWKKAYQRSRQSARILALFMETHHRLVMRGTTKNLLSSKFKSPTKRSWLLIQSDGRFRTAWNFVMMVFIFNTATYGPFRIAFIDVENPVMQRIDIAMDIFFIIDIILTFVTDYQDPKTS